MKSLSLLIIGVFSSLMAAKPAMANVNHPGEYWLKIKATNKYERSAVVNLGANIEVLAPDYVVAFGTQFTRDILQKKGILLESFKFDASTMDFPANDSNFHNYTELQNELVALAQANPDIVEMNSIGKSVEGRNLFILKIHNKNKSGSYSGVAFLGTHHAREHVSTEIPLMLAQYLVNEYRKGNARITGLVDSRNIYIIPLVNPDGAEYDVKTGQYQLWRKNRGFNGSGVDLNRNYGYMWGTGGSSSDPSSETFKGPSPFSEPESQAVKAFIDSHTDITSLLSFHTFSQLVLYPWGHSYDSISDAKDVSVFKKMATTMAAWNGYTPEQASDLYIASGDTTDWAYGTHKIFAFTFELDPGNSLGTSPIDGFYPGEAIIASVFQKNIEPCLYMIDYADNPYRVVEGTSSKFGLHTNLLK